MRIFAQPILSGGPLGMANGTFKIFASAKIKDLISCRKSRNSRVNPHRGDLKNVRLRLTDMRGTNEIPRPPQPTRTNDYRNQEEEGKTEDTPLDVGVALRVHNRLYYYKL